MATPAHQETRRFTRGLGKPGTAAELRQSVSEVVRTSVLVVSTRRTFPFSPLSPLCLADLLGLAFTHIFCWPGAPVRFTGELFRMRDPDTQTRKLFRQEINEDAFCPQKCNWSRWWQTRVHVNLKVWGINCINCCNPCIIIHKNVSPELTWSLPRLFCGLFFALCRCSVADGSVFVPDQTSWHCTSSPGKSFGFVFVSSDNDLTLNLTIPFLSSDHLWDEHLL